MSSLLNIGVSALRTQQSALAVIGQNVTNASTPGYSRQRVEMSALAGSAALPNSPGAGVTVSNISRVADELLEAQVRRDTSAQGGLETMSDWLQQLEVQLFDDQFGIDAAMGQMFAAFNNAASEPADLAAREFVLSSAAALVRRFNAFADHSIRQNRDVTAALASTTAEANELSAALVDVNARIAALQADRDSVALNSMLDRRNLLLKELSAVLPIESVELPDGQVNVFLGKGQPLVLGAERGVLQVDSAGDVRLARGNAETEVVNDALTAGRLGGLLSYRETALKPTENRVGQLAAALTQAVNDQHQLGTDLAGEFGSLLFRDLNDPMTTRGRVTQVDALVPLTQQVEVRIDDPFSTPASDYQIHFDSASPGAYSVRRLADNEIVLASSSLLPGGSLEFDGISVSFSDGAPAPGTTLEVRPYANVMNNMQVTLNDASRLALAGPVAVAAAAANLGEGTIQVAEITDARHPGFTDNSLQPPLYIEFLTDDLYRVMDNSDPLNPQPLQPDLGLQRYASGVENHVFPTAVDAQAAIADGPAVGALQTTFGFVTTQDPLGNGYAAGSVTVRDADGNATQVDFAAGASAREIANAIAIQTGVSTSAYTELTLSDVAGFEGGVAAELTINGYTVSQWTDAGTLADAINDNAGLAAAGIIARSDGETLQLMSANGDDLSLHMQGDPNEGVTVSNSRGETTRLRGTVTGEFSTVTVGGQLAVILGPDESITASAYGLFAAEPVTQRVDRGYDLLLGGNPQRGDRFDIDFSEGAIADNRNARRLAAVQTANIFGDPARTLADGFGAIVQQVGAQSAQTQLNLDAADALLQQAEAFRESVAGVNLDEEAASLIKHEQAYNAATQLITVARDIFNALLNAV